MRGTLLEPQASNNLGQVCLSFDGWTRYSELKKGRINAKKAFMAMPFGNTKLDKVYDVLKSAVADTGFTLMRLDEKPKAGVIDNHLRVEIETSRFLVVDLTTHNFGAYWEAGFAEGLRKPVFYSYEKEVFKKQPSHFDANHSYTLLWEIEKLEIAAAELKDAIRATLPDELKMNDD